MEGFKIHSSLNSSEKIESSESPNKEEIFKVLVMNEIIDVFTEDLDEAGFSEEQVAEFEKEIESLTEDQIKGVLSTPKELRLRNFPRYLGLIESKKKSIKEIVLDIANIAEKNGFTLGYHASNSDILPKGEEWQINGKELDDRDELAMAYYSLDYKNIFRAHRFKFLYIIRAQTGSSSTHKRDTSNNWGRASTLSIVDKMTLTDLDEQVDSIFKSKSDGLEDKEKSAA